MTPKWSALAILASSLLAAVSPAQGASLYTETFTGTTGGWQDREVGSMTVTNLASGGNPDGCLSGTFPLVEIPSPIPDAFMATGTLASANFVGDYSDVDAYLLGFDFRANNVVPGANGLQTIIRSGANFIFRTFESRVITTGQWYRIRFPLLPTESQQWLGDTPLFSSIMTNVTKLEIQVTRNGTGQQTYLFDNVFLDRLPEAVALSMATGGVDVTWLNMRAGEAYRFEAATDLVQSDWVLVSNVTASGGAQVLPHVTTNFFQGYRIVIP